MATMSSSDWAQWVGAVGTVLAAAIAVLIYWFSKRDVQRQLEARRRVLHSMLRQYVRGAAQFVPHARDRIAGLETDMRTTGVERSTIRIYMHGFKLRDIDRMIELQADLMEFGEAGDAAIAGFIEACRQYDKAHAAWLEVILDKDQPLIRDENGMPTLITAMRTVLERLTRNAEAAVTAIDRWDKS
jgi:hypothetical protein